MEVSKDNILNRLDKPCQELLAEVQEHISINFFLREDDKHECDFHVINRDQNNKPKEGQILFYEPIESAKIVHELLHAKCSCVFLDDNRIFDIVRTLSSHIAKKVLTFDLCQSILNQAEHYIIYPHYIHMGYDNDKFVESLSFDHEGWNTFVKNYQRNNIKMTDVYNLINTLHHIVLFPIDNRFKVIMRELKHIERELFDAFKCFRDELPSLPQSYGSQEYSLIPLYKRLFDKIDKWCAARET